MNFSRLFEILEYQRDRYPQAVAAAGREGGQWRAWTTSDMLAERDRISAGLLDAGLHPHARVGILARSGSPQWMIADAAMMQVGIVPVPVHVTARPDEMLHISRDANVQAWWVSDIEMLKKLREAGVTCSSIFSFQEKAASEKTEADNETFNIRYWTEIACEADEHLREKIQYYRDGVREQDLATLLYTSGTTGLPKGVMLSHENIVSNVKSVLAIVPISPESTTVSFLPMSHIFERMVTYCYVAAGASVWFADSIERLPKILIEVKPHFFAAVPRVLERMHERLLEEMQGGNTLKRKVMRWAISLGERYPYAGEVDMPADYYFKRWLADFLVFRHWRKRLGGQVRYIVVGAAALPPRLGRLFSAAGIEVREGYGLTETSPVIAFNRFEPGGVRFGSVGIVAPGVEVRIAEPEEDREDGEIEVRGPNVMMGYAGLEEETRSRFTDDGWFRTGDLGKVEHKRFLKVTGRKSEIFKTSSGKFVAPAYVEQKLNESPFISQSLVLGANQPHVAALIVPDFVQLEIWSKENGVHWTAPQFMALNPKIKKLIQQEIERINQTRLGTIEKVRAFELLHEPWTAENGMLTPSLKVRRDAVTRAFDNEVKMMFRGTA